MTEIFKESKLNLISFSPLNTDRMTSVYNAVKQVGKIPVIAPYTAYILEKGEIKYNSPNLKVFCITDKNTKKIFKNKSFLKYGNNRINKQELINNPEKYIIKDSQAVSDFLSKHHNFEQANLIYSYWGGYMDREGFR